MKLEKFDLNFSKIFDIFLKENAILTTNDIVINKLTQILSYLRNGKRDGKKIKKKVTKTEEIEVKKDPSADLG